MTKVTDPYAAAPTLMKQWTATGFAVEKSLDKTLVELVKIRSSILNGCANCINMHTIDARAHGETEHDRGAQVADRDEKSSLDI